MSPGGLAQITPLNFANAPTMLPFQTSGLASRRGSQQLKPLSVEALKSTIAANEAGMSTPRTVRSHLLAGLRTAPKSATAAFPNKPASSTATCSTQNHNRNSLAAGMYDPANEISVPKTSVPHFASGQAQSQMFNNMAGHGQQQFVIEPVLGPHQLADESPHDPIDPNLRAQLLLANQYLSEQQQRLQYQLRQLQAAAQQYQGLNLNGQTQQMMQLSYASLYQQQQHALAMQQLMADPVYTVAYDSATGQPTLYVDQAQQQQRNAQLNAQMLLENIHMNAQQSQVTMAPPRLQVSPPTDDSRPAFRNSSPAPRRDSPLGNHAPLPPPSAFAFRRVQKKLSFCISNKNELAIGAEDAPTSAAPRTTAFPITPVTATGSFMPGQARAGEHPLRQPRNPPSMDELRAKPTSKYEGSKNFMARTRRSALSNLVRAGQERRKEVRSSSGSISLISEIDEELPLVGTPLSEEDNDSLSGRSGSGSLVDADDAESSLPSSRNSTGSWGAIGSDRPSSRQKNKSEDVDVNSLAGSFASLLKSRATHSMDMSQQQSRKTPMLVLTSAEKRRNVI